MFRRDTGHTLSSFIEKDAKIEERDEEASDKNDEDNDQFVEEEDYKRPQLDPQTQGTM